MQQSDSIVLRRSRPLQISLDGEDSRQVWTTASTVQEALAQLQMTDKAPAAASRGSRVPLAGMSLPVVSAKTVQLNDAGVMRTLHLAAPNVAGLLEAAGVPLEQKDAVVPAAWSPVVDGMQIQVTRIRIDKVTQRVPLPPNNKQIPDVTHEHEPSGRRRPRDTRHAGRHLRRREGERRGDRQVASSQCRCRAGPRRRCFGVGAKPGTEVPPVSQRSRMGRARAVRIGR